MYMLLLSINVSFRFETLFFCHICCLWHAATKNVVLYKIFYLFLDVVFLPIAMLLNDDDYENNDAENDEDDASRTDAKL